MRELEAGDCDAALTRRFQVHHVHPRREDADVAQVRELLEARAVQVLFIREYEGCALGAFHGRIPTACVKLQRDAVLERRPAQIPWV